MRSPASTSLRRAVLAGVILLVAVGGLTAAPASAATPGEAEATFFALLNQSRAQAGLPALQNDAPLAGTSRTWSAEMASRNQLSHDPNLAANVSRVEPSWQFIAENVGAGYDVRGLHDAFLASSAHRANMMSSRANRVGIGVVYTGTQIWVTVRFLQGPPLQAASSPAPVPTGLRTVLTGDFDGDGRDDLLTYGPGDEADELWFGTTERTMRKVPVAIKGQYQPIAGDFDGDGRTNILWYAPGSAADSVWEWNGTGWSKAATTINGRYTARSGDFDNDGVDDILWYAPGDAADYRWYGNRNGTFTSSAAHASGSFIPLVGDFDGNGGDDVLWYARGSARDAVWYSTNQRGAHRSVAVTAGGSHTPFAGDFDGNGVDDIFFYTPGSAADVTWFNTTGAFAHQKVGRAVDGTYLAASADFDGNGADDVLWFSPAGASGDPLWWGAPGATSYSAAALRAG